MAGQIHEKGQPAEYVQATIAENDGQELTLKLHPSSNISYEFVFSIKGAELTNMRIRRIGSRGRGELLEPVGSGRITGDTLTFDYRYRLRNKKNNKMVAGSVMLRRDQ